MCVLIKTSSTYFSIDTDYSCVISFIPALYHFNYRLAGQCTAQLYSYITRSGGLAKMITCVGHSLGAHVCGMMSNHLTKKQYKIIGQYIFVPIKYSLRIHNGFLAFTTGATHVIFLSKLFAWYKY